MSAIAKGWGVRRGNGELVGAIAYTRAGAQRLGVWYSGTVADVHYTELNPPHSSEQLNDAERLSWRVLYRQGMRAVRVELREARP